MEIILGLMRCRVKYIEKKTGINLIFYIINIHSEIKVNSCHNRTTQNVKFTLEADTIIVAGGRKIFY